MLGGSGEDYNGAVVAEAGCGVHAQGERVGRSLSAGLNVLCGLVVAAAVISFLRHASGVIAFPYELAAGEELVLRDAVHLLSGQPVYSDVNHFPFVVSNYPPLFALVSSLLVPLLGVSLTATRMIASLSTLLCACLIGLIVHQGTRARVASALCGGIVTSLDHTNGNSTCCQRQFFGEKSTRSIADDFYSLFFRFFQVRRAVVDV